MELIEEWYDRPPGTSAVQLAAKSAQWGADQELTECLRYASDNGLSATRMRETRRPKPQTLNSIALQMLGTIEKMDVVIPEITDTIRRALEALDD